MRLSRIVLVLVAVVAAGLAAFLALGSGGGQPQQQARAQVVQEVAREAAILAFNDIFFVIGSLSALAFVVMFARWLYDRWRGVNPLAKELEALQKMLARTQ